MAEPTADFRLGIISGAFASHDGEGRLVCNHSTGRMWDLMRKALPGAKLCLPVVPESESHLTHVLGFPAEDVVPLPPMQTVISSQKYYFQARRILRQFVRQVDVLFIRWPFQLPSLLLGLGVPKVMHVVGNAHQVISASTDYRGVMKRLALAFAAHSNRTATRMAAEPHTRVCTNGAEMWDVLRCRAGRVVVSSNLYEREMRPREDRRLGNPPRLLFVGFLRPEKGILNLLTAFEQIRRRRPLKLTLVGGNDNASGAGPSPPAYRELPVSRRYRADRHGRLRRAAVRAVSHARRLCPAELVRGDAADARRSPGRSAAPPWPRGSAEYPRRSATAKRASWSNRTIPRGCRAIERILDDEPLRLRLIDAGLQSAHQQPVEYFVGQLLDELVSRGGEVARGEPVGMARVKRKRSSDADCRHSLHVRSGRSGQGLNARLRAAVSPWRFRKAPRPIGCRKSTVATSITSFFWRPTTAVSAAHTS